MSKPFASSADTSQKTDTLEVLADGVYALTAEGDPNVGAVEGEDEAVAAGAHERQALEVEGERDAIRIGGGPARDASGYGFALSCCTKAVRSDKQS